MTATVYRIEPGDWESATGESVTEDVLVRIVKDDASLAKLIATNLRLNRRCQKAESELATLRRDLHGLPGIVRQLRDETLRANRYAGDLRDIYRHRTRMERHDWIHCWWCKLRRVVRFKIWNQWFSIKPRQDLNQEELNNG